MNINTIILTGNVASHPEIKYTKNNVKMASFSIAQSKKNFDSGNYEPVYIPIKIFGDSTIDFIEKHISKGCLVSVQGTLNIFNIEVEGKKIKSFEVKVECVRGGNIQLLFKKQSNTNGNINSFEEEPF